MSVYWTMYNPQVYKLMEKSQPNSQHSFRAIFCFIFSIVSIPIEKKISHFTLKKSLTDACRVESIALFRNMSSMIRRFVISFEQLFIAHHDPKTKAPEYVFLFEYLSFSILFSFFFISSFITMEILHFGHFFQRKTLSWQSAEIIRHEHSDSAWTSAKCNLLIPSKKCQKKLLFSFQQEKKRKVNKSLNGFKVKIDSKIDNSASVRRSFDHWSWNSK